jgi:excisionase family DNA binding protein
MGRNDLRLHESNFPRKREKTGQNTEILLDFVFSGVEICSAHRNPLEHEFERAISSQGLLLLPETPESEGLICGRNKNSMADSREVMNIRQASQYLGVSPDTLYKYVNEQKIPAFKLGNRWRFKKSKLDQWMEEKSNEVEDRAKRKPKAAVKAAGTL